MTSGPTGGQTDGRRCVAVVLAGGLGSRVGLDIPKQLITVAGHTILEHTVGRLDAHPQVDDIVVLMAPGHLDTVRAMVRAGGYDKVTRVIEGAETRNGTTQRALDVIPDDDAKVLVHDAVRPLVSQRIISECLDALDRHDAVDVAIPSADTIIEVDADNTIAAIPRRDTLRRGQTPQAFRAGVLREAYRRAWADPAFAPGPDDCTVVLRYAPQVPIWVVPGEERNMKVTDPIDVYLADKLFQLSTDPPAASLDDAARRRALEGRTLVVFGGGSGIGADMAALASSYDAGVFAFSRSTTGTHVERRADVRAALETVRREREGVDYVVVTAAVLPRGLLTETSAETVRAATEINYLAPVVIAQEAHGLLRASRGSLLNFTSSSYTRGRRGYSLYSSAKAAVVNLTQALADEWSADGIRVNCVNPGRTGTPMRTRAFGDEPPETLLRPRDVAERALDVLVGTGTGLVVDVRRDDPFAPPTGG